MRYRILSWTAVLVAAATLVAYAFVRNGEGIREYALGEFAVNNLSCGSCVANIRKALGAVDGVGEIEVSVTTGKARVEFVPRRIAADKIAERISRAGYPAKVKEVVSVDDYRNLREDESRLTARYVGRIGEKLVSRKTFAEVLARREAAGVPLKGSLLKAVWEELLQRHLLLAAAERNGVVVQDAEIDLELQRLQGEKGFEAMVASAFGNLEDYRRELKDELTIRRNIENFVLKGEDDPLLSRQVLDAWYRNLVGAANVTIFDPALKAQVEGGGKGCGGCC